MIGFILGTSEGKEILSLINKYTNKIVVSTATAYGGELLKDYDIHYLNTRPLDKDELKNLINKFKIEILVDASHPYAKEVSINSIEACKESNIKYIRYERSGILDNIKDSRILRISNFNELKDIIGNLNDNYNDTPTILNTTGSNNISQIMNLGLKNRIIHRILPSATILKKVLDLDVKIDDIIAIKGPIGYELNKAFINEYKAKVMITKDSGIEGGVEAKLKACIKCNINLIVIDKPKINYGLTFYNKNDLIKYLIEKFISN